MKFVAAFVLFAAVASKHVFFDSQLDEEWEKFKRLYGKTYKGQEEQERRRAWEENLAMITQHNVRSDLLIHSFRAGINEYSDMDHKEFVQKVNGFRPHVSSLGSTWVTPSNLKLPETVDWRNQGYVTPIKNQGLCGSCWAFSATGSLEGQHRKKTGQLVSLSEQNLVDCSGPEGNNGCFGGFMDKAFEYIKKNNGIDTEEAYPYWIWKEWSCHFKPEGVGATCSGYVDLPKGDEKALQEAVATVGPISVGIDASQYGFQVYSSGIYDEPKCTSDKLDHGVLVVGYGTDNGTDFWLVKNSWGTSWGMDGYVKMVRNKNNHCGIATNASYPLV